MRLFFALACPPEIAAQIVGWRSTLGVHGQPVTDTNLHLTLAFLGQQPGHKLSQLLQVAESIKTESFTLKLDQLGCWSGGLLHLAPSTPPQALLDLASRLRQALHTIGIALEHHDYRPHLTLARHCEQPVLEAPHAFSWDVEDFRLYLSQSAAEGVNYKPLASWKLQQPN